nr:MAG TPA: MLU1-BOX BINDING PROTEIN REGULATION, CELL-CYCLE, TRANSCRIPTION FACTOR.1A [Caudoviricetes sp.]
MTTVQINNLPVEIHVTDDGETFVRATDLLQAIGYRRPSDALIHYEEQTGKRLTIMSPTHSARAKWFPLERALDFLAVCRYRRNTAHASQSLAEAIAEMRGGKPTTEHQPAPRVRRPESKMAQNDRAAGIAWLTGLLEDTTLPYALHLQALKARAELLDIQAQLAGGTNA